MKLTIFLSLFVFSSFAISEVNYKANFNAYVRPHFSRAEHGVFKGQKDFDIHYFHFKNINAPILVISPGQGEPAARYAEVAYDLRNKFEIYIIDHRGQGSSTRALENSHISYVEKFEFYADDLNTLVSSVVEENNTNNKDIFLLAHSMGGMISTVYLAKYNETHPIKKAVLSAPMHQVNTSPFPHFLATGIVGILNLVGQKRKYGITQEDYYYDEGYSLKNTSSVVRAKMKHEIFVNQKNLTIGGTSNRWIGESFRVGRKRKKYAKKINIPVLLFQAGDDEMVKARGQDKFCKTALNCKKVRFPFSRHEILLERDLIRDEAFKLINRFLIN